MKLYFTLSILLTSCFSIAQSPIAFKSKPRTKIDYDKPGNYEMVIQIQKSEIDPKSSLDIDIYFSGYGEIRGSKIFFSTEEQLFNDDSSYVLTDLSLDSNSLRWGGKKQSLKGNVSRFSSSLHGVSKKDAGKDWMLSTPFVDYPTSNQEIDSSNFLILTELKLTDPPLSIHLGDCGKNYGNHTFTIVFTYFNGVEWKGQSKTLLFHINNPTEPHPVWAWVTGIIIFLITVLGVVPVIYTVGKKYYKWIFKKLTKENKNEVKEKKAPK